MIHYSRRAQLRGPIHTLFPYDRTADFRPRQAERIEPAKPVSWVARHEATLTCLLFAIVLPVMVGIAWIVRAQ